MQSLRRVRKQNGQVIAARLEQLRDTKKAHGLEEKALEMAQAALSETPRTLTPYELTLEYTTVSLIVERDKRRTGCMLELGKGEAQRQAARKRGCTHSRHANVSKNARNPAPRGTEEWTTGGQLVGRDDAMMACLRCVYGWKWKPTYEE